MAENCTTISRQQGLIYGKTLRFILQDHGCYKYERLTDVTEHFNIPKCVLVIPQNLIHFNSGFPGT